ncbi:MAG TPA: ABC transporter permease [Dongiaceae bacterium]|nr:ABC transporter permease [Dongiaceae bacterium]
MPPLANFIVHRLAAAALTLVGAILFLFIIIQFVPGDLAGILLGPRATPELRADFAARMGLDRSIPEQALLFFSNALRGDLGNDIITHRPILDMVFEALPNTLQLAGAALLLSMVFGIALGCIAALKPGSMLDTVLGVTSVAFITTPAFVVAIFLLLIFSIQLHWLPVTGGGEPDDPLDRLAHLVLPATALSIGWIGYLARLIRASLLEVLSEQHVRMMRAYGVPEGRIVRHFALRLALVPMIAVMGLGIGDMISNAVFVEFVFARPGIGTMIYNAIRIRNFPVVQAGILFTVLTYVLANLLVDLLNALLDPRIARSLKQAT